MLVEAVYFIPYSKELFSNRGFHLGPYAHLAPSPPVATLLCVLLALTLVGVTAGFLTRFSIAVALGIRYFLYQIDHINEKAIYTICLIVLAVLLFSPCGYRYSVDAWLRRKKGKEPYPHEASIFTLRLLQLQFAQVYFFAGLVKLTAPDWVSGKVMENTLTSRWATDLGIWVSGWMPRIGFLIGAWGTIGYELTAPFLLFWKRARPWVIAYGVAFHLSIDLITSIGSLGLHFMWALLVLFPEPQTLRNALENWRSGPIMEPAQSDDTGG
jgi:hypothetical protein